MAKSKEIQGPPEDKEKLRLRLIAKCDDHIAIAQTRMTECYKTGTDYDLVTADLCMHAIGEAKRLKAKLEAATQPK